jgi:hypothetical protein
MAFSWLSEGAVFSPLRKLDALVFGSVVLQGHRSAGWYSSALNGAHLLVRWPPGSAPEGSARIAPRPKAPQDRSTPEGSARIALGNRTTDFGLFGGPKARRKRLIGSATPLPQKKQRRESTDGPGSERGGRAGRRATGTRHPTADGVAAVGRLGWWSGVSGILRTHHARVRPVYGVGQAIVRGRSVGAVTAVVVMIIPLTGCFRAVPWMARGRTSILENALVADRLRCARPNVGRRYVRLRLTRSEGERSGDRSER